MKLVSKMLVYWVEYLELLQHFVVFLLLVFIVLWLACFMLSFVVISLLVVAIVLV